MFYTGLKYLEGRGPTNMFQYFLYNTSFATVTVSQSEFWMTEGGAVSFCHRYDPQYCCRLDQNNEMPTTSKMNIKLWSVGYTLLYDQQRIFHRMTRMTGSISFQQTGESARHQSGPFQTTHCSGSNPNEIRLPHRRHTLKMLSSTVFMMFFEDL